MDIVRQKAANTELLREDIAQRTPRFRGLPQIINLNSTSICNLRCVQCFQAYSPGTQSIPLHRLHAILEQVLPTAEKLRLTTAGEPLFGDFEFIVEQARIHRTRLEVITNGTLMTPARFQAMEGVLDHLAVSIDSHDEATLDDIRGPGVYRRVRENLHAIRHALEAPDRPFVFSFNLVLMVSNVTSLPAYLRFAREVGVDHVRVLRLSYMTTDLRDAEDPFTRFSPEELEAHIEAAREEARRLGLNLFLQEAGFENVRCVERREPEPAPIASPFCNMLMQEVYIQPDEMVTPCCIPADLRMGSLKRKSFEDIWNGRRYQRLRRQMFTRSLSGACKRCKYYEGVDDDAAYDYLPGSRSRSGFRHGSGLLRWVRKLRRPASEPLRRSSREVEV